MPKTIGTGMKKNLVKRMKMAQKKESYVTTKAKLFDRIQQMAMTLENESKIAGAIKDILKESREKHEVNSWHKTLRRCKKKLINTKKDYDKPALLEQMRVLEDRVKWVCEVDSELLNFMDALKSSKLAEKNELTLLKTSISELIQDVMREKSYKPEEMELAARENPDGSKRKNANQLSVTLFDLYKYNNKTDPETVFRKKRKRKTAATK